MLLTEKSPWRDGNDLGGSITLLLCPMCLLDFTCLCRRTEFGMGHASALVSGLEEPLRFFWAGRAGLGHTPGAHRTPLLFSQNTKFHLRKC